jgi:dihydroneopterin aldolase
MSDETTSGDQIHIEGLEVSARVGVSVEERKSAQRLVCNLTFWRYQTAALQDDINQTVDYAALCAEARSFIRKQEDRLIETLADRLALHLLQVFEIGRITVEIRKFVLPAVDFVSATVTRERAAAPDGAS